MKNHTTIEANDRLSFYWLFKWYQTLSMYFVLHNDVLNV